MQATALASIRLSPSSMGEKYRVSIEALPGLGFDARILAPPDSAVLLPNGANSGTSGLRPSVPATRLLPKQALG
ncbi:hypothetical protein Pres01_22140 [Metapseudomonas resinovorans]|nr:hypothetical protein Pres01_22140 [Pseudomonas resinovorans]